MSLPPTPYLERDFHHWLVGRHRAHLVFLRPLRLARLERAETKPVQFRPIDQVAVTPAQRAMVWFLFVSSLLFFLQTLTGGLFAHYRAEPEGFFGIDFSAILPFNVMRTWHVQLAIFWVSASYLATGIFIVPLISGRERRGQGALTIVLLIAVAIVVFGSLAGEYAGAQG